MLWSIPSCCFAGFENAVDHAFVNRGRIYRPHCRRRFDCPALADARKDDGYNATEIGITQKNQVGSLTIDP